MAFYASVVQAPSSFRYGYVWLFAFDDQNFQGLPVSYILLPLWFKF